MSPDEVAGWKRLSAALEALSVGDAFGDLLPMKPEEKQAALESRALPDAPWRWTDDSNMAFSIAAVLRKFGEINQDALAQSFADHYDISRGYGASVHRKMRKIREEKAYWRDVIQQDEPSFGNGAAMRVAPIGAYFFDDIDKVVEQAKLSAEVTHAHPEGIAGAIAVAVAAAVAWQKRFLPVPTRQVFLDMILPHVPDSEVREKIRHARNLAPGASIDLAASALGDGRYITAQDTVAFTLWCAGGWLHDYEEALWFTVSKSGDRDTNCAIVGGIVVGYAGLDSIPKLWRDRREPFPDWFRNGEL
jgi:ADP-ribosylglycohydrolase